METKSKETAGAGHELALPYSSLAMRAIKSGMTINDIRDMPLQMLLGLLEASADDQLASEEMAEEERDGNYVREATQDDIKAFI